MTPSAPLSIGSFAMLTGLSVPALRHYDAVGVLAPASVDPDSGYRYYATDQIAAGRAIRALRALDLPLDEVGEVVNGAGAEHVRGLLLRHRARLKERASALDRQMADLEAYIEKGVPVTTPP